MPTWTTTHTEPFHVSKAIATLDYVSAGRAGVQARVSRRRHEARHFGRRAPRPRDRTTPGTARADLFDEAADFVEVLRRLWDSWEDDAEIRDVATGRFIDRDKLHYIDFEGRWFSVKGPSITPRPPQGQPLVTAWPMSPVAYRLAARRPTCLRHPATTPSGAPIVAELRGAGGGGRTVASRPRLRRPGRLPRRRSPAAAARARPGSTSWPAGPYRSDALVFAGTPRIWPTCSGWQAGRDRRVPPPAGRHPPRPRRRHPTAGARCSAGRVPAALRGAARLRAGSAFPAREPLCPGLSAGRGHGPVSARHADPPRRALPRGQQHHGVERPARPAAISSSPRSSHLAQTAERAKFDFFFLAEGLRLREQRGRIHDLDVVGRPDTFTVLAALAAVTDRIGLSGTINSTFNEPYEVARQFASLDHLSAGRAAWNVVTSWDAFTGENFRRGGFLPAEDRYERAREFLQTARELWDSWDGDAIVADPDTGVFLTDAGQGTFEHHGRPLRHRRTLRRAPVARRVSP